MSSTLKDEPVAPVGNRRLRRIRPAPQLQTCCGQQSKSGFKENRAEDKKSMLESDRRRKRRESDARCRANLSSCFTFLRAQVEDENQTQVKMSKEALLYHSIDQIQYLEAILVLLQQTKETSMGTTPSQPVEILQDIHKEFISKKHGTQVEQLTLCNNGPETSRSIRKAFQPATSKQSYIRRKNNQPTTQKTIVKDTTAATAVSKTSSKRTVPNILLKKVDSKIPTKNGRSVEVSKPKIAQQVPTTPTHGDRSGLEAQEVPCTPTKATFNKDHHQATDLNVTHYRIKGKDITPSKVKASQMCDDCQIQKCLDTDLNCYEDPADWSTGSFEKLLQTPQQSQQQTDVVFRTPKMKRKPIGSSPTEPRSSERRSRKCLFENKLKQDNKKSKQKTKKVEECSTPKKSRYFKRATAARTRAWDPVALKVTSPLQPYSGIYSQRKKSAKVGKAKAKTKKVCKSKKKIIKAVGLGPALTQKISVTDGGATIDHTKIIDHTNTSRLYMSPSSKVNLTINAEDECKSRTKSFLYSSVSSQDSLSIAEVPHLPPDICKLISRGGDFFVNDAKDLLKVSPCNTSQQLISLLDDGCTPWEEFSGNDSYRDPGSMNCFPTQQERVNFDPTSSSSLQSDPLEDGYKGSIDIKVIHPTKARTLWESVSNDFYTREEEREEEGAEEVNILTSSKMDHQTLNNLDGLIQRNVWQGRRNQDITLAQLQRQPIFGTHNSVYRSPMWMGNITSRLQASKENQFVDIESSDSGPLSTEKQESWDTVDFLSSISDASGQSQFSRSSSQHSSESSSSVPLEPGCAAARAIEEYQVVPHYRPEE